MFVLSRVRMKERREESKKGKEKGRSFIPYLVSQ
jgi:hypothetical protein